MNDVQQRRHDQARVARSRRVQLEVAARYQDFIKRVWVEVLVETFINADAGRKGSLSGGWAMRTHWAISCSMTDVAIVGVTLESFAFPVRYAARLISNP